MKVIIEEVDISVIIPTYKPKNYVYECLESLENQTIDKKKYEVFLIINGDEEPYKREITKYVSNKKMKLKIIYSKLVGVSNARNLGLDLASGKNIIFIDDDDFVSLNYLEILLKNKEDENTIIQANVNDFYDNTNCYYKFLSRNYKPNSLEKNLIKFRFFEALSVVTGKLIPKTIIGNTKFNTKFCNGEDTLFISEISKNINLIKTVDENVCYYRRKRTNSLHFTKIKKIKKIKNLFELIKIHFQLLLIQNNNRNFILYRIGTLIIGCFR